ncbi:MAG: S8 family serine peptidase, partial [Phycisphaerae bacterium]|nr:S8 family serine peptidase [Phycisphaerae bacterium]
ANSPCTPATLPGSVFDPDFTPSPLMTGGLNGNGDARGYQAYTQGPALLGPSDLLPAGVGASAFSVTPPSVRANNDHAAAPKQTDTNLGTLQFLLGGYRGGGFDLKAFETLSESLGISGALVRGNKVAVAVIEHAAYVNHEDLINRVTAEAGQTQLLINAGNIDPNHGTAVLGIIGAEANDFGITGIASKCDLRFYPIVSREEGSRLLNALVSAIIGLDDGDIMNMSIGGGIDANGRQETVPSNPAAYNLIQVGTSAGITSIISAGNDAAPVKTVPDGAPEGDDDSGAIIIGACWPGFQNGLLTPTASNPGPYPGFAYCRMNFSSFTDLDADRGGEVHMSGWGTAVTTCGYGDLFSGTNDSADPLQVNRLRNYTAQFNGTSSAAPVVSGLAARIQSFSKRYFGVPLPPAQLRSVLASGGHNQCSMDYGNPAFPGYPEDGDPSAGDLIPIGNGGQLARIGPFPNAREALAAVVSTSFGGNPVSATVITGILLQGNQFSIRVLDGTYLVVDAVRKRAGTFGSGYGPPLFYPMTGGTTDVQVQLQSVQSPENVNTLSVANASAVSANIPVVQLIYLYNRVQNRWISLGWGMLTPAQTTGVWNTYGDPRDYVLPGPNGGSLVYSRVYTCGLGPSGYTV